MVGLYGVIAYRVLRRRNEIGIRLSLGASRASVVRLVSSESVALVAVGVAIGTAASFALGQGAGALLFGLSPQDVSTQFAAVCLLAVAAGFASGVPAWRAARLDPTIILREE